MRRFIRFAALLPILVLLSCASTSELVRRGEVALDQGDMEHAYDWARRALDREPRNAQAQGIMANAGASMVRERKTEVLHLAEMDTIAAARAALELDEFRAQIAHYRVTLPPDPDFHDQEAAIYGTAARIYYDKGVASLANGFPKRAYAELGEAKKFAPGDPEVAAQLGQAWERAISRVAILPFNDDVSSPELARQLSNDVYEQMEYQLKSKHFVFTRLIGRDQVNQRLTVAQAGELSRDDAVKLGRALGATRVVFARIHDLRSDVSTDTYHETIYRKIIDRGEDGKPAERYDEQQFEAVSRRREIRVTVDLEVIETAAGARLARDSQERSLGAHTVFTRFSPAGSCDDYSLMPPDWKGDDRAQRVERQWKDDFGSWTLPALLEKSRRDPGRTRYESRIRPEFAAAGTSTPVWLDDLPPVEELAYIALSDSWMPMLDLLRNLDGKDDAEFALAR
jgi:tetratricopeptide (TPR) repeat protein